MNYTGKIFLNCANGGQKSALAADSAFGSTLRSSYGTDFSEAQGIFNSLNSNLESVIAKGPGQQGETADELAAQNSQAINTAAGANKQIQQAIGEKASMSGAVPGVESGVTQAVRAGAESQVENNLANTEANITQKNYDIGREQYNTATKEQMALPEATMAPVTQAGEAVTQANDTTGKQANEIANSSNSWMGLVGGLASSAAKAYAGGG